MKPLPKNRLPMWLVVFIAFSLALTVASVVSLFTFPAENFKTPIVYDKWSSENTDICAGDNLEVAYTYSYHDGEYTILHVVENVLTRPEMKPVITDDHEETLIYIKDGFPNQDTLTYSTDGLQAGDYYYVRGIYSQTSGYDPAVLVVPFTVKDCN